MYPEIALFMHRRARKRRPGSRRDPWSKYGVRMADAEAREIRRLWKAYFGKSKRNDARHLKIAADRAGGHRKGLGVLPWRKDPQEDPQAAQLKIISRQIFKRRMISEYSGSSAHH